MTTSKLMMCGFRTCAFRSRGALAVLIWMCMGPNVLAAEMTMADLLELIRQNERLYADIDVSLEETYVQLYHEEHAGGEFQHPQLKAAGAKLFITKEATRKSRHMSQRDLYRTEVTASESWWGKTERVEYQELSAYDGQTTRVLVGQIGNIARGKRIFGRPISPHMLLLRFGGRYAPLSVHLGGDGANKAHALGYVDQAVERVAEYKGVEEYEGLRCHVVWLVNRARSNKPGGGAAVAHTVLWFPEERNLIPMRMVDYRYDCSRTVPIAQGNVTAWLEVEPGIWFPQDVEVTSIHPRDLHLRGEQVANWRHQFHVSAVSLAPNHDVSFFQEVVFPQGAVVYELDESGKIIRGYQEGAPRDETTRPARGVFTTIWWAFAALALLLLPCTLCWMKRRRGAHAS